MDFRTALIVLNIVALAVIAGVIVWRVFSLRRNPEPKPAPNLTPFLRDEDLEGRHLERVLGWALIFTVIIAVALPLYFLFEPTRQVDAEEGFLDDSIERGAVLYANEASPSYESEFSLLCANCHGLDGTGGSAPFVLQPEADFCLEEQNRGREDVPECLPKQVTWEAPSLTLAALRYDRRQLTEIITYGRPGTPMPAWGVASGKGVLNEQGVDDLVNYIESIQTTPDKAKAAAAGEVEEYRRSARELVGVVSDELAAAQGKLADARTSGDPDAIDAAQEEVTGGEAELTRATAYRDEVDALADNAILFRLNCARCHTKGWSYYVTEPQRTDLAPLAPQGSGAYGPNLRDGSTLLQFPGEAGAQEQFDWVAVGVPPNELYGQRGISSGRMPHFGRVLTDEQITGIVEYERSL